MTSVMTIPSTAPQSLCDYILARFDEFSRSQRDVAQYIVDHLDDTSACDQPRSEAFLPDTFAETAATLPGASVIDLTDLFCDDTTCFAVVGGVITHRDFTHITDEFSLSYAPYLAARIAAVAPELFEPAD